MNTFLGCRKNYLLVSLLFVSTALFSQQTEIQVLSAVVKDQVIPDAQVIFQKNGETSIHATTDIHGKINIPAPFGGIDDASVTIIIKKDGYSTLVTKGPCNGLTYAISPVMSALDGLRVVLSWNEDPLDIDSHLAFFGNHVYFEHKTGTMVNLDVDDTDGYGPETITIEEKAQGKKYVYAVHDYTDMEQTDNDNLSGISNAKVFVYIGNSLVKTYMVPQSETGNLWVVFMIDENGAFQDIDQFSDADSPEEVGRQLQAYLGEEESIGETVTSQDDIEESVAVNQQGEDAYHAGDLESSVDYYQQAIDLDPNNGQAYSNLGLSYQKLGREAEAIWANRKAIALAHGPQANTIKASSYYNIAKIYESKGQWHDALDNYSRAKENKSNAAYDNGINRMKVKLGQ